MKTIAPLLVLCSPLALAASPEEVLSITGCVASNEGGRICKFPTFDFSSPTISLQFEDEQESVVNCIKTKSTDTKRWHGECLGSNNDANFIKGNMNGVEALFGSIHIGDEVCHISPNNVGESKMKCTPDSVFEDELEAEDDELDNDDEHARNLYETTPAFTMSNNLRGRRRLYADDGKHLDLLVVWTKSAECGYSNLGYPCVLTPSTEAKMRNLIDLAVTETDDAFALSGIDATVRVVHAYRHETYEEPTSNIWNVMAAQLKNGGDGYMDDVHQKRSLYGADAVHLISGSKGSCGVGYVGPTKAKMFSVSRYTCMVGYYSFSHEIAHNLGAHHDRGAMKKCDSTNSINHGFKNPDSEFRSIMAYDCQTNQCDGLTKKGCPRVQRFSNQANLYNNKLIGDAMNDNASVITQSLVTVATYFPAMDCQSDSECDDNDPTTINSCNLANNACVFTPDVPVTEAPTWSPTRDISGYGNLGFLETIVVNSVSTNWQTVTLSSDFTDPVAVCSVKYNGGTTLLPAVARLRNVSTGSFDVKLQNPKGTTIGISPRTVHCLVVEKGVWELPDGRPIEAASFESTVTDSKISWEGEQQSFQHQYTIPVILGQVMSFNDPKWSTFWSRGVDVNTCADQGIFFAGKHVGETSDISRSDETVGYIVMEGASHGKIGSMEFDFGRNEFPFVAGYTQNNYLQSFTSAFSSGDPEVTLVSQCSMRGADGSWAVLTTESTGVAFGVAVDEDQQTDSERAHLAELLNFAAFSSQGALPLVPLGPPPLASSAEPSAVPSAAPSMGPSTPPSVNPTSVPSVDPSAVPSTSPSVNPTEGGGGYMESVLETEVGETWKTVYLWGSFTSPIPSCSVKYDSGTSLAPAVVRMQNVQPSSFEIRLQNPGGSLPAGDLRTVHCVAVEEGLWSLPDGRKVKAFQYDSTETDRIGKWAGQQQALSNEFSAPVILGQVMTFNDARWMSFWSRGATNTDHAEAGGPFFTGKHVGQDPVRTRNDESVGVIVIDSGHSNGSIEIEAGRGATTVSGYITGTYQYTFTAPFTKSPEVAVVSMPVMLGNDGVWPVLTSDPTPTSFGLAVDEDQIFDSERWHIPEPVDYLVFSDEGTIALSL